MTRQAAALAGVPKSVDGLRRFGPHHYSLVRAYALVISACSSSPHLRLVRWRFEWELTDGFEPLPHRPDALCSIAVAEQREVTFWIEVDTSGTESPSFVRRTKFLPFARHVAARTPIAGMVPDVMLVLVRSDKRIRALLRTGPVAAPVYLRTFTEESTSLPLTSGWTALSGAGEGLGGGVLPE